jgi:2-polyprenyl-3-methyl-5-hydroxy-6-metoxy-1,4-benzoquinol methylase
MSTRWFEEWSDAERATYADRFIRLARRGQDIDGEARFVDALADRHSRILDAGCGTGRVAAALAARGHDARGVDADATLIDAGRGQYPGLPLEHRNLLDLTADDGPFDVVVAAGNVLVYVDPGTEAAVLRALASVLSPGGSAVLGFATDREYTVADLDRDASAVGWRLVHRFSTWQLDPWTDDADWAVSVFR